MSAFDPKRKFDLEEEVVELPKTDFLTVGELWKTVITSYHLPTSILTRHFN